MNIDLTKGLKTPLVKLSNINNYYLPNHTYNSRIIDDSRYITAKTLLVPGIPNY